MTGLQRGVLSIEDLTPATRLLERLVAEGASGELIASGEAEVHVFLIEGRIAWATTSSDRRKLTGYLIDRWNADPESLRQVIEECKRTRRRFGEVVIERGILTLEQVREGLRDQVRTAIAALEALGAQPAVFLRRHLEYSRELTFELGEVVAPAEAAAAATPAAPLDQIQGALDKLIGIDGFLAAVLVDSESGSVLGTKGDGSGLDLAGAAVGQLEVLRAQRRATARLGLEDAIEDLLINLEQHYLLLRPVAAQPALFFYLVLDRARANLGLARLLLMEAERGFAKAVAPATGGSETPPAG